MITKCFIDLDGVLADFMGPSLARYGKTVADCKGCNWIPDICDTTDDEFWSGIDEDFWANLPVLPDAQEILIAVHEYFDIKQVAFLTSGGTAPTAFSGKMKWVQKNFPHYRKRLLVGYCKEMCAAPDSLLIDDWDKNTEPFRQAGGSAILLPRPWNKRWHDDTLTTLRESLRGIMKKEWYS